MSTALCLLVASGLLTPSAQDLDGVRRRVEELLSGSASDPAAFRQAAREAEAAARAFPGAPSAGAVLLGASELHRRAGDAAAALETARFALSNADLETRLNAARFMATRLEGPELRLEGHAALLAVHESLAALPPQDPVVARMGGAESLRRQRVGDLGWAATAWNEAGRPDQGAILAQRALALCGAGDAELFASASRTLAESQRQAGRFEEARAALEKLRERHPDEFASELSYQMERVQHSGLEGAAFVSALEKTLAQWGKGADLSPEERSRALAYVANQVWAEGRRSDSREHFERAAALYEEWRVTAPSLPQGEIPLSDAVLDRLCAAESHARVGRLETAAGILRALWTELPEERMREFKNPALLDRLMKAAALDSAIRQAAGSGSRTVAVDAVFRDRSIQKLDAAGRPVRVFEPARFRAMTMEDVLAARRGAAADAGPGGLFRVPEARAAAREAEGQAGRGKAAGLRNTLIVAAVLFALALIALKVLNGKRADVRS